MPQTVRAVVAKTKGAPVEIVDIVIPDPGPGEVVVRIETCGVCHTDLHYREGGINDEFPFLLGPRGHRPGRDRRQRRHQGGPWETGSCWPGAHRAGSAGPAPAATCTCASTAATRARR